MSDPTEFFRKIEIAKINGDVESNNEETERARLEKIYGIGNVWNTSEVTQNFEILSFLAPYCAAIRRTDGKKGLLQFQHNPRLYFDFE